MEITTWFTHNLVLRLLHLKLDQWQLECVWKESYCWVRPELVLGHCCVLLQGLWAKRRNSSKCVCHADYLERQSNIWRFNGKLSRQNKGPPPVFTLRPRYTSGSELVVLQTVEVCTGRNFRISPGLSPKYIFKYVTVTNLSPTSFYSSPNEARSIYNLPLLSYH
jgi:hypothetical protein